MASAEPSLREISCLVWSSASSSEGDGVFFGGKLDKYRWQFGGGCSWISK